MELTLTYEDYTLNLYDEVNYNPQSADNAVKYEQYYSSDNSQRFLLTQHGIRVTDFYGQVKRRVCIAASGGRTGIHERCYVLGDNTITICCADTIFSLMLPDLSLRWKVKSDSVTCFEIFRYKNGYIVHGELEITSLNDSGIILWQFAGDDIFTTPTGRDSFKIVEDIVCVKNWNNVTFKLDADKGILRQR